ncbi:MAG: hypothetical protein J7L14_03540, partial [Candidatus Diapherotrites archaeon]|nr:hypothetical protein [Candidatus Diapherotrites archaeon]
LRNLHKEGYIKRLEGGRYCSNITYGVVRPLLLHDVHFRIEAPYLRDMGVIGDVDEFYGDCHLKVRFGKKRGQITGFIAYDRGMDKAHVLMLMRRIYEIVEKKTGHRVEKFRITTLDWNRDFYGKRIDNKFGIRCFTIGEFEDFLTRIYQKDEFTVRVEAKTSRELTIDELLEIQRTGSIGYLRDGEIMNQLMSRLDNQALAIRWMNRKITDLEEKLDQVVESLNRLVEPLSRLAELSEKTYEEKEKRKRPEWMI